jgi:hypothetical protein
VVEAAGAEQLVAGDELGYLRKAAAARAADPSFLPADDVERAVDLRLVELAATVALRRHARPQVSGDVRSAGRDLRRARLVVGSGGVFRHAPTELAQRVLASAVTDPAGGWKVPEHAALVIDHSYVLAAAGLLAATEPATAWGLLRQTLAA